MIFQVFSIKLNELALASLGLIEQVEALLLKKLQVQDNKMVSVMGQSIGVKENSVISITIDGKFEDYSKDKQQAFLEALARLLNLEETEIRISQKRKGSIKLVIEMPKERVKRLVKIFDKDQLKRYQIKEIQLIADSQFPLIKFSSNKNDIFTLGDAFKGTQIFGGIGTVSNLASYQSFAYSFFKSGYGGLILINNAEETNFWKRLAIQSGREEDLIIFGANSEKRFNFIDFAKEMSTSSSDYLRNF